MKRITVIAFVLLLLITAKVSAESVTIVYQNDLHGWLFPSSTRVGIGKMAGILAPLFEKEPSSFYTLSGDLFTGPNLPNEMKGISELMIWNAFWKEFSNQGYGERILMSAGNHEFDYGVPEPGSFDSGLLCANLVNGSRHSPYYTPYKVLKTGEGLNIGFMGLLIEDDWLEARIKKEKKLELISPLEAASRFLPEMENLDLTVLMIHDHMTNIIKLAEALPPLFGVDLILSGHDHYVFESPQVVNGICILQAGAMNNCYGRVDLSVKDGAIKSLKNRIVELHPTPLEHSMMQVKEKIDELNGKTIAVLKQSLSGSYIRNRENSLGDFVTDAFRWATKTDVAMTNSASLRMDCKVYPGEFFELKEGHLRSITPYGNHLMVGKITGVQIMQMLEGEAENFQNQVSGLHYKMNPDNTGGKRIIEVRINGKPLYPHQSYTITHNSYCTGPKYIKKYLHLNPGSVKWRDTKLVDHEVLLKYARHLKVIDYPPAGEGRIMILE